jgi:hypothetical protein
MYDDSYHGGDALLVCGLRVASFGVRGSGFEVTSCKLQVSKLARNSDFGHRACRVADF